MKIPVLSNPEDKPIVLKFGGNPLTIPVGDNDVSAVFSAFPEKERADMTTWAIANTIVDGVARLSLKTRTVDKDAHEAALLLAKAQEAQVAADAAMEKAKEAAAKVSK